MVDGVVRELRGGKPFRHLRSVGLTLLRSR